MMKVKVLVLFCVLKFTNICGYTPIVKVEDGALSGTTYNLLNGREVNAFFGIPYAAPPISDYRFQGPQKLEPWSGVWNASYERDNVCLQLQHTHDISVYAIKGIEDCLYLNIFTPKLTDGGTPSLMNVIVNIHGGAFMFGTGNNLCPDYLLQEDDIVYVTFNYRLGILGFFSTGDDSAPGNFGMKDQVAALKWVKRNIDRFGGNPSSITIMGVSAGAVSVHYHMISPLSDGLFHKALSFSGTVLPPWSLPSNITQKSVRLAHLVGCPMENTNRMLICLRKKSAKEFVEASKAFMMWRYAPFTSFGPVIEPKNKNAFLSEKPIDILKNGKVKDIPWMSTSVQKEGLYPAADFIHSDVYLKQLNDKWNEIAPNLLMYNYSVPETDKEKVSTAVKDYYFGGKSISKETVEEIIQLLGDRIYFNGITEATGLHNFATSANIYCYKFKYRGESSLTNFFAQNSVNYGVSHGDDMLYFLRIKPLSKNTEADKAVVKLLSSIIVTFMNNGNPGQVVPQWEPISKKSNSELNCLSIYSAGDLRMEKIQINSATSQFWKTTIPWEQSTSGGKSLGYFILQLLIIISLLAVINRDRFILHCAM